MSLGGKWKAERQATVTSLAAVLGSALTDMSLERFLVQVNFCLFTSAMRGLIESQRRQAGDGIHTAR